MAVRSSEVRQAPGRAGVRGDEPVYAALDLGTNNCRLLMAKPDAAGFRVVGSFSRVVRLGEGLASTGQLAEAAIARTLEALGVCAERIRAAGAVRVRGVATEACRRASNGGDFLSRAADATGLTLEPISTREEAALALVGCAPLLCQDKPRAIVFDIGGGSTEVMWVACDGPAPRLLDFISVPFGVVTVAERAGGAPMASLAACRRAVALFDASLALFDARNGIAPEVARGRVGMVGTSGTVTTLGAVHLGLARYDRARVNGLALTFAAIAAAVDALVVAGEERVGAHPCVGPRRADLVFPGCALLEAILRRWAVGWLRVADRGIREGILALLMERDGYRPAGAPGAAPALAPR